MFSDLAETLHILRKSKNKQAAKLWRIGATIRSPEGLKIFLSYFRKCNVHAWQKIDMFKILNDFIQNF